MILLRKEFTEQCLDTDSVTIARRLQNRGYRRTHCAHGYSAAEILTWLDENYLYALSVTAHHRVAGPAVPRRSRMP